LHTELVALILYRRHTKACPIHKSGLKARAKRLFMDCECPFRMYGRTDTSFVPRQSTGFTGLAEAEALRSSLIAQSKDETVHGPRIADCVEKYLAARRHELGEKTSGHYRLLLSRLQRYCEQMTPRFAKVREIADRFRVSADAVYLWIDTASCFHQNTGLSRGEDA
jgi:hypothetical protein